MGVAVITKYQNVTYESIKQYSEIANYTVTDSNVNVEYSGASRKSYDVPWVSSDYYDALYKITTIYIVLNATFNVSAYKTAESRSSGIKCMAGLPNGSYYSIGASAEWAAGTGPTTVTTNGNAYAWYQHIGDGYVDISASKIRNFTDRTTPIFMTCYIYTGGYNQYVRISTLDIAFSAWGL